MDVGDDRDAHRRNSADEQPGENRHRRRDRRRHEEEQPPGSRSGPVTTAARSRARATTPRSAAAGKSSQPIVADPNVASWRRGSGSPAADGTAAWCSAVVAGPTCAVPHTSTMSTTASTTSPTASDHPGASARRELGDGDGSERDQRDRRCPARAVRGRATRRARRDGERARFGRAPRAPVSRSPRASARACGPPETRGGRRPRPRARPPAADADPASRRARRAARQQHGRRLHRAEDGVRRSEAQGPGVSGRLRIPSLVWYFDHESWSAAMSSSTNRGEALIRETTAPGTSPSSISCSIRVKVSVNS